MGKRGNGAKSAHQNAQTLCSTWNSTHKGCSTKNPNKHTFIDYFGTASVPVNTDNSFATSAKSSKYVLS